MDVSELLAYKPEKPSGNIQGIISSSSSSSAISKRKRRLDDDAVQNPKAANKRPHAQMESIEPPAIKKSSIAQEDMNTLNQILEDERTEQTTALDEPALKKLLIQFEKKFLKNQEMRIKYSNNPEKFMESEIELNETIQELQVLATTPNLYRSVVASGAVKSFLQLISHENADIAIAVVDLLQEMTDGDSLNDSEEEAEVLLDALMEGQLLALLVQNLERLDENSKEEATGIHNSLAIVENMVELRPQVATEAGQQGLVQWLIKKLKIKAPFDDNRLYYSEILSILVQNHPENCELVGELEGMDILLSQLFVFKKRDPASPEEIEYMENLFNSLCSCLMQPQNRGRFLKGEGLHLMNLMLKEKKKMCRTSALKVLDYSMNGEEGAENCNKYVEILGLTVVFPFFMKPPHKHKKAGPDTQEIEEHVVSVVASLVRNCESQQRQRLVNKFIENDHEKVDRLMELHFKYLEKAQAADDKIEAEKKEIEKNGGTVSEEDEEEFYMSRLEAGLFTLQLVDYIMLEVCLSGPPTVKARVTQILNLRNGSMKTIKGIIREYAGSIGNASDKGSQKTFQDRLIMLVDRF